MKVLQGALVLFALLGVVVMAVLRQPLDISGNVKLPSPIERVKERDGVSYRAHRAVGTALFDLAYPSDAVALQWLKAAGHSRTDRETERAVRYFAAARERADSPEQFDRSICRWIVGKHLTAAQWTVVAASGTSCG